MRICLRRREFIAALSCAASGAWPVAVRGQQAPIATIGFLDTETLNTATEILSGIRRGLEVTGFFEGRNLAIEYRFAENNYDRLPSLAADLVSRKVAVIVTNTATATRPAKAAAGNIPIVFLVGGDPVEQLSLVASYNRPGGNLTGVTGYTNELWAKRMQLMREVVPSATVFAVILDPNSAGTPRAARESQTAARALGRDAVILHASDEHDLDAAFTKLVEKRSIAVFVQGAPFFFNHLDYIAALAARHSIPTNYPYAVAGGLISYGTSRANYAELFRQMGVYTGRILNGEKPGDLPIVQPTKFELVINLKTAKALGLTVPLTLLTLADEVIE
jgi:putative ABC transport system substrate-binding protein